MPTDALMYPVGPWVDPGPMDAAVRAAALDALRELPGQLRMAVDSLTEAQLEMPYRPGGWTIRQVVHHLPDSHMNAYVRMKLALTEPLPAVRSYEEQHWAELPDGRSAPIGVSLDLLEALHRRWVLSLERLPEDAFARGFVHPVRGVVRVDAAMSMYAWHGRHHLAHIAQAVGGR